jgi:hypothetical protein
MGTLVGLRFSPFTTQNIRPRREISEGDSPPTNLNKHEFRGVKECDLIEEKSERKFHHNGETARIAFSDPAMYVNR